MVGGGTLGVIDNIKNIFRKGGMKLNGQTLNTIFDHDRIDFDGAEYQRISKSMQLYRGQFEPIEYINSKGSKVKREYYDLNMMKEVTNHLAKVLYNEKAKINVGNQARDYIDEVLTNTQFNKNFSSYLEPMLALGGLIAKPYYDANTGRIEISWALADSFIPLYSNTNDITAGVFTSTSTRVENRVKYYYTLLEFHEWDNGKYVITNELYKSSKVDKVGEQVLLSELYEDLNERTEYLNFSRPNFVYLKPNGFNNINPDSPLGLGVCDNALSTLKFINDTYDAFHWEIKQGKRKVLVSDHFVKREVDSEGNMVDKLDDDTDVFLAVRGGMDSVINQDLTKPIRSDDYIRAINKVLSTLEMKTGLSAGTFTFDAEGVKTATEVVSRDSTTYRTRNSHLTYVEQFIKELVVSILELSKETIGLDGKPLYSGDIPLDKDIVVDFDDGVFSSKAEEMDFLTKADALGALPMIQKLMKVWNLDEEEAIKWAEQIKAESQPSVHDNTEESLETILGTRE